MSDHIIKQFNLEYLINKQYNTQINKDEPKIHRSDKKFYRKRIINMVRNLLMNDTNDIPQDIQRSFNYYIKQSIEYFKLTDLTDTIQETHEMYDDANTNVDDNSLETLFAIFENDPIQTSSTTEINNIIMKSPKIKENTLDTFIKRNKCVEDTNVFPTQKIINLKNPAFKNKGICKKKYLNNTYEEEVKLQNEKSTTPNATP